MDLTGSVADSLLAAVEKNCKRAAELVSEADVLLLCTGAGFSADSGLAVYADVACVEAYAKRNLTYPDLCQPQWLESEPDLFWGFWGQCFNDYRGTAPHSGYEMIDGWVQRRFRSSEVADAVRSKLASADWPSIGAGAAYRVDKRPGAFFAFTSNVDAHHFDWFRAEEVHECHGNTEIYQCSDVDCSCGVFRAPADFAFRVDADTMMAGPGAPAESPAAVELLRRETSNGDTPKIGHVRGGGRPHRLRYLPEPEDVATSACAFQENHPKCPKCGKSARPAILMFGDASWIDDEAQHGRFNNWLQAVNKLVEDRRDAGSQLRVTVLEVGAGHNVPTVRRTSERCLARFLEAGADAHLVRVNNDQPLGDAGCLRDGAQSHDRLVSIMEKGLPALTMMQQAMPEDMQNS